MKVQEWPLTIRTSVLYSLPNAGNISGELSWSKNDPVSRTFGVRFHSYHNGRGFSGRLITVERAAVPAYPRGVHSDRIVEFDPDGTVGKIEWEKWREFSTDEINQLLKSASNTRPGRNRTDFLLPALSLSARLVVYYKIRSCPPIGYRSVNQTCRSPKDSGEPSKKRSAR